MNTLSPTQLLVDIGQLVLKDRHSTDWLNLEDISRLCKENEICLNQKPPTPDELESHLRPLFQAHDEIWDSGVNVVGMDRREGWDLVFSLRFYKYNPEHRLGFITTPAEEALAACND
jgi:hypothetical protein